MARPQSPQKHIIHNGIAELEQLDIAFTVPVPHTHTQEAELEGKPGITIKRSPSKAIKSFKQKPSMRETKANQISQIESRTKLSTAGFTRSRKPTQ